MDRRYGFGIVLAIVLLLGVIGICLVGYSVGISQGLAQGVRVVAPESPGAQVPYYGGPSFFPHPFGFGFGIFGLLFVGLILFLVFVGLRRMFWRGWMGGRGFGGGPTHWDQDQTRNETSVPSMFEEWHRRAHARESGQQSSQQSGQQPPTDKPQP